MKFSSLLSFRELDGKKVLHEFSIHQTFAPVSLASMCACNVFRRALLHAHLSSLINLTEEFRFVYFRLPSDSDMCVHTIVGTASNCKQNVRASPAHKMEYGIKHTAENWSLMCARLRFCWCWAITSFSPSPTFASFRINKRCMFYDLLMASRRGKKDLIQSFFN